MVNQYIDLKKKLEDGEKDIAKLQLLLDSELTISNSLRKSLKQVHESSKTNEWNLLEQVSTLTKNLNIERSEVETLKKEAAITQSKLVEVESFLHSDEGMLTLQLEEQLASCRLQVAQLEAEKDYYEVELRKKLSRSET